jgi:hypothetical protein
MEQIAATMTPGAELIYYIRKSLSRSANLQMSSNQNLWLRMRILRRNKVARMATATKVTDKIRFVVPDG